MVESLPIDKEVKVMVIPKCTTGMVQPLDVYGFRVWKSFVRFFYDLILLHDLDVNIHLRDNILRVQSFTHNQLSSPRYANLWKYGWSKAGYLSEKPPRDKHPVSFVFRNENINDVCDRCDDLPLIVCSWCTKSLCLSHFFTEIHLCDDFVD